MPENRKKIGWIVPRGTVELTGTQTGSNLASVRYRALIPMRELAARGHEVTLMPIDAQTPLDNLDALGRLDTLVLSKNRDILDLHGIDLLGVDLHGQIIDRVRARGGKIVYDLCDDQFDDPVRGPQFLSRIHQADAVVAATASLADTVAARAGRTATTIADPFEGPKGAARWAPGTDRLNVLWFGHWSNLDTLEALIPELLDFGARRPLQLTVVTITGNDLRQEFKQFNQRHRHQLSLRYVRWSVEATWNALVQTDVVVIPQWTDRRAQLAKSPNRLVESFRAGRFVVANPIPAYREFGEWAAITDRISDGLEWAMTHQGLIQPRIAKAQDYIEAHYSPRVIADQWENVLTRL